MLGGCCDDLAVGGPKIQEIYERFSGCSEEAGMPDDLTGIPDYVKVREDAFEFCGFTLGAG